MHTQAPVIYGTWFFFKDNYWKTGVPLLGLSGGSSCGCRETHTLYMTQFIKTGNSSRYITSSAYSARNCSSLSLSLAPPLPPPSPSLFLSSLLLQPRNKLVW